MSNTDIVAVACSEGVNIYCPRDGRLSFFNSPYFPHRNYAGIDIYLNLKFGEDALSPVSGEVVAIREVNFFEDRGFEHSKVDYLIILRSLENKERLIKILHVKPEIKVGDKIAVGERIGTLIRSGFFDFWTDPHIHVEVREPGNPIRARGGYRIRRLIDISKGCKNLLSRGHVEGVVIESRHEYSLIALNNDLEIGIPVNVGDGVGLIEGGIPHYGFFGVHVDFIPKPGEKVIFLGENIGSVKSVFDGMCLAEVSSVRFSLNGKPVRLSLYLSPSKPVMKVIPQKAGDIRFERSEKVTLSIS
ncbi:MAG: M23 family metallopeptidase [Candidatus Bathyarchaeota archaeon]|nr:M23 family metallopeptidase [Candidatus Bathyarchaeota archaeon]